MALLAVIGKRRHGLPGEASLSDGRGSAGLEYSQSPHRSFTGLYAESPVANR